MDNVSLLSPLSGTVDLDLAMTGAVKLRHMIHLLDGLEKSGIFEAYEGYGGTLQGRGGGVQFTGMRDCNRLDDESCRNIVVLICKF
jgi:hypothetical protein